MANEPQAGAFRSSGMADRHRLSLYASTALAIMLATMSAPALADGGGGSGATGGADAATGAGGNGGNAGQFLGGGGGGSGATGGNGGSSKHPLFIGAGGAGGTGGVLPGQAGGDGQTDPDLASGGGGGGGGGAHGHSGSTLPFSAVVGGAGGAGGAGISSGDGGGGGAGGWGAAIVGLTGGFNQLATSVAGGAGGAGGDSVLFSGGEGGSGGTGLYLGSADGVVVIGSAITGGRGGAGGNGGALLNSPTPRGGDGGNGGAGIHVVGGAVLWIDAAIIGGNGGIAGAAYIDGIAGAGGAGIVGSDLSILLGVTGRIEGGYGNGGAGARADAIAFTGGQNYLNFESPFADIHGDISIAGSGVLTLIQAAGDTVVGSAIVGAGDVRKTGSGTITLMGDNTYSGATTVYDGTLAAGAFNSFSAASAFTVSNGAGLDLGGFDQTIGSLAGAGAVTNSGGADAVLTAGGDNSSTVFSGLLEDGATNTLGLTKVGAGRLTLSGDNTYSGVTIVDEGTLAAGASNSFSAASAFTISNGAGLDLGGFDQTIGSLAGAGIVTNSGGADAVLTAGGDNSSTVFSGMLQDGATNALGLTKVGAGLLTLSGDNTYSGATTISAGVIEIAGDGAGSENSDYSVNMGAALEIADDVVATIGSLADGPDGGGSVIIGSASETTSLFIGGTGAATVFSGQIGGAGSLDILDGSLTLTGASAIGGDLIVDEGAELEIAGAGASFATGALRASSATVLGKLDITGGADFETDLLFVAGEMIVDGTNTTATVVGGPTFIGLNNIPAMLTISGGGVMESEDFAIIESFAAPAGAVVTGGGSTWNIGYDLVIGNFIAGGTGTLAVLQGGTVNVTGDTVISADTALTGLGPSSALVSGQGSSLATAGLEIGTYACACGDLPGELTVAEGGVVTATDSVKIGAMGVLNIGAGGLAGSIAAPSIGNDGRIVADFTDAALFDIDVSGTGSLVKNGVGTLILAGDNSFTGGTTVNAGTLLVGYSGSGTLGGPLTVRAGGILGGTGDIGSAGATVAIEDGGIHLLDAAAAEQKVLGDYVNHGTLRIAATPTGAGKIIVAGNVDITGATLHLDLTPTGNAGWNLLSGPFTIIDKVSAGDVTGVFLEPYTQSLLFLDTLVDYNGGSDGNDVTVRFTRNDIAFASVGQTRNQIATGTAIDLLDKAGALWNAIASANDPDLIRASFDALSGEVHASARGALVEDSRFVRNAANDRIRAAFDGAGASYAPVLAYGPGGALLPVAADDEGPAFWSQGFGSWGTSDSDGNAAGLDRSGGGLLVGADGSVGDWRIGLLAGYGHSRFEAKDRASSGRSDNYHLGLYAGTNWSVAGGDVALRTGAAYTWHDLSTSRAVAVPGVAGNLSADYRAATFQAFGELGYGIDRGNARFEPFASLAHVSLRNGGFAETGGAAAVSGAGATTGVTFATLGLRAEHTVALGGVDATLRAMAGWRHAFGDTTPQSALAFPAGSAFTIAGTPIARDSAVVEAGFDLDFTPDATFGLSYVGQLSGAAQDHGVKASLSVRF